MSDEIPLDDFLREQEAKLGPVLQHLTLNTGHLRAMADLERCLAWTILAQEGLA